MKRATLVLAALALLSGGAGQAKAVVIFTDNFNTAASPLWGNEVGNWTASGGVYFAQSPNNIPPTYSGLPFTLGDFSIDVDINKLQDGGIWLHSIDNEHGVLLVTGGRGGTGTGLYWHVITNNANNPPVLNEKTGLFIPGVSNAHIKVVVSGNTYSAFVNGASTPATTLTDSTYLTGRVGLYDFSHQTFDNVVVTTPDASSVPEPSSLALLGMATASFAWYFGWWRRKHIVTA